MAVERIYKVQRPLRGVGPLLVYTKGKQHLRQIQETELGYHDILAAMQGSYKCFFPGKVVKGQLTLKLSQRVPTHKEPPW